MRIAVGSIFTESNHLVGLKTLMKDFERTETRRGDEILSATDGVLGGSVACLRANNAEIVPLTFASAVPGGPLTLDCYNELKHDILTRLKAALPVDGVLMPMHGAAAVDEIGDLDGDLIAAVRQIVGSSIPVVVTLDCHAQVTRQMVDNADALLAWETYPHRDTYTTGERGAALLVKTVRGEVRPTMAMAKAPVIVGGFMGGTEDGPFAEVMRHAKSMEGRDGVLSTSAFLVQPHLDLTEMGGGGLVITDNDMDLAIARATELAQMYWERRYRLETQTLTPTEAIAKGMAIDGPVILLETSDCVGGGASGDSAAAARALIEANLDVVSLAPVVDGEASAACHAAGVGATVSVTIGHKLDRRWGQPFPVTGVVETLSDGTFVYSGGIWGGQVTEMGPSACLRVGNVRLLLMTHPTYDWADEQFRTLEMDPASAKFIVVKNPMNYRVGYAGRFNAALVLDTPGPTPASVKNVPFTRVERPYFPVDQDIPGFTPTILRGRN